MLSRPRKLELLAPARDVSIARQAILHGADAVYIGAMSHGARAAAANALDDLKELVEFAHPFRAKIYATVNTIVYEKELLQVERLIRDLYRIGIDALIVQDLGILRLDIPPIELHASTQCDIRTPEKALWLQEMGFSQIVLARELTIKEITEICKCVKIPVECFVHGALCVSYSGRCHASLACGGRSANRGECAQMCRLPYTLTDARGNVLARDRFLLSMHDLNASANLPALIEAGVSSFKIEGRLKDMSYVKNIVAHYSELLNRFIGERPDEFARASAGSCEITFQPDPTRSFNRGFTDFCQTRRRNRNLACLETPKALGQPISDISELNNGDGISWLTPTGYTGTRVNRIERGRIITPDGVKVPLDKPLYRTYDVNREKEMARNTATRKIAVDMELDLHGLSLHDERGVSARVSYTPTLDKAKAPPNRRLVFEKLGNTIYTLREFTDNIAEDVFIPNSELAELRRVGIAALDLAAEASYCFHYRRPENREAKYPSPTLDYRDNISNSLAEKVYREHGVTEIERAAEATGNSLRGRRVMTSRHCILRQLGLCLREKGKHPALPLILSNGHDRFLADFDCDKCEMHINLAK